MARHFGILAVLAVAAAPAMADMAPIVSPMSYTFERITNSRATDIASQLQMDVYNIGGGQVQFTFLNLGPIPSSIADIYFDQGPGTNVLSPLESFVSLSRTSGVSFSPGASPQNLPSGNSLATKFTADLSADSNAPVAPNGINPGEWLNIVFALADGQDFTDVITDLRHGLLEPPAAPWLRVGLHVQSIGPGGQSDSFVDAYELVPYTVNVPAPGALVLATMGLGLVGWTRRRMA